MTLEGLIQYPKGGDVAVEFDDQAYWHPHSIRGIAR